MGPGPVHPSLGTGERRCKRGSEAGKPGIWTVRARPVKRRDGADNWSTLDLETRKNLMAGHARVGRKYGGRISQLISGSTGLDDWEWGVTLVAHQVDALKEIVYEMRFDEVTARYGGFGEFYINIRLSPAQLWQHLHL